MIFCEILIIAYFNKQSHMKQNHFQDSYVIYNKEICAFCILHNIFPKTIYIHILLKMHLSLYTNSTSALSFLRCNFTFFRYFLWRFPPPLPHSSLAQCNQASSSLDFLAHAVMWPPIAMFHFLHGYQKKVRISQW